MPSFKNERIDTVAMLVYFPVPPRIFKETEKRIHMEMAILEMRGENPATVTCIIADEILRNASD